MQLLAMEIDNASLDATNFLGKHASERKLLTDAVEAKGSAADWPFIGKTPRWEIEHERPPLFSPLVWLVLLYFVAILVQQLLLNTL